MLLVRVIANAAWPETVLAGAELPVMVTVLGVGSSESPRLSLAAVNGVPLSDNVTFTGKAVPVVCGDVGWGVKARA